MVQTEHIKRVIKEEKDESNLDLINCGITGGIFRKRSIGVTVSDSKREEPIGENNENRGSESDFDLPKRGNKKTEDGEIHGGYNQNGHDNRSERERNYEIER